MKSGISSRALMPRRTRSAASARRRTGPAMVPASSIDSTIMTSAATRKTCSRAKRSEAMILSMSPPCVESSSAPRTERKRCTGTATETMVSPRAFWRTTVARHAGRAPAAPRAASCRSPGRSPRDGRPIAAGTGSRMLVPGALDEALVLLARAAAGRSAGCRRASRGCANRAAGRPRGRRCAPACGSA